MMKIKKHACKAALLMLYICSLSLFSGCHGAKETLAFEMPETFDTTKNHEITFWAKNDTNRLQVDIYEKAIADFEALYPNVKVNIRLYTDYGKIYNDVITNIATNTTPNVCITYPDHIATYLTGENQVVPMDALFFDRQYGLGGSEVKFDAPSQEEIIPKFLEECAFNGHYYAVPYMRSSEACYINKTFVERLGYTLPEKLTWDFLWEVSEAAMATDAEGNFLVNNQKVMVPFIYKSTDNMMITMLKQKEAGYSTSSGEIQIFNDTTKDLLYTMAEHGKTRAFSTFKISSYPANFLNAGQCIFAIDSTAGATWMGTDAPLCDIAEEKIVEFETVVMELGHGIQVGSVLFAVEQVLQACFQFVGNLFDPIHGVLSCEVNMQHIAHRPAPLPFRLSLFQRRSRSITAVPLGLSQFVLDRIANLHRPDHKPVADLEKLFRGVELLLKLLHQIIRKGRKIFFTQTNNQKCTCQNVIDMAILIPERTVEIKPQQFAFLIANQSHRLFIGINRFNIPADSHLQAFQSGRDFHGAGFFLRFHHQDFQFFLFHDLSPFFGNSSLKLIYWPPVSSRMTVAS